MSYLAEYEKIIQMELSDSDLDYDLADLRLEHYELDIDIGIQTYSDIGDLESVKNRLKSFEYLQHKIKNHSTQSLIAEYRLLGNQITNAFQFIQTALSLCASIVDKDHDQLSGQLWGRLSHLSKYIEIQDLLNGISTDLESQKIFWVKPITQNLNAPDTPLNNDFVGHENSVKFVEIDPSGKWLVSLDNKGNLRFWNLIDNDARHPISTGLDSPTLLIVTNNKIFVASDSILQIRKIESDQRAPHNISFDDPIHTAVLHPQFDNLILVITKSGLSVYDIIDDQEIIRLDDRLNPSGPMAISPNGRYLAIPLDDRIQLLDLHSDQPNQLTLIDIIDNSKSNPELLKSYQESIQGHDLYGHYQRISSVIFSHDSKFVISASGTRDDSNWIKVWDIASRRCVKTMMGHYAPITSLAVSLDNARVISGASDRKIKIWDIVTGKEIEILEGHNNGITAIKILNGASHEIESESDRLVSASDDHTIKLWDTQFQSRDSGNQTSSYISSMDVTPDGAYIVAGHADGNLSIWDAKTGQRLCNLTGHKGYVYQIFITPDGKRMVSSSEDKTVRIWDIKQQKELLCYPGYQINDVTAYFVRLSIDGRFGIGAIDDKKHGHIIEVWDYYNTRILYTIHNPRWVPDYLTILSKREEAVVFGQNFSLIIWDLRHNQEVARLGKHSDEISSAILSSNERFLISGSKDHTIKIWDLITKQEIHTLKGHRDTVIAVDISQDDLYIASVSSDRTMRIWDIKTGTELLKFTFDTSLSSYHFLPTERKVAVGDRHGRLHIISLENMFNNSFLNENHSNPRPLATILNVRYEEREEAKDLGARWANNFRKWYVPPGVNTAPFQKWLRDIIYLNVPLDEKDQAKELGAQWDRSTKKWIVPLGVDANRFKTWMEPVGSIPTYSKRKMEAKKFISDFWFRPPDSDDELEIFEKLYRDLRDWLKMIPEGSHHDVHFWDSHAAQKHLSGASDRTVAQIAWFSGPENCAVLLSRIGGKYFEKSDRMYLELGGWSVLNLELIETYEIEKRHLKPKRLDGQDRLWELYDIILLDVPLADEEKAKARGARYHQQIKKWYILNGNSADHFREWIPDTWFQDRKRISDEFASLSAEGLPIDVIREIMSGNRPY